MAKVTFEEFGQLMALISENFGAKLSEPMLNLWYELLDKHDVTTKELKEGVFRLIETRVFTKMPAFAELLQAIRPGDSPSGAKAKAEAQADLILENVRRLGPNQTPVFSDPITNHLMSSRWPWGHFCRDLQSDQTKWWRRDFVDAYHGMNSTHKQLPARTPLAINQKKSRRPENRRLLTD